MASKSPRRDNSLSRRQPGKGGGKLQPTLRGLDSPKKGLDGPVAKGRHDVKTGSNPNVPLKGPVGKVYAPDPHFGGGKGKSKRQRGKKLT